MVDAASDYEDFVLRVSREFYGVDAVRGKVFIGRITKRKIKVDVSFEMATLGGARILTVLECKRYNHKVSVEDVEEFHSKIDDIGAHKGVMVTTRGYQDGAKLAAIGRGIGLALLTTEPQPGELQLQYVVASGGGAMPVRPPSSDLLQGNICGVLSKRENGFRFDGFGHLLGILLIDAGAVPKRD